MKLVFDEKYFNFFFISQKPSEKKNVPYEELVCPGKVTFPSFGDVFVEVLGKCLKIWTSRIPGTDHGPKIRTVKPSKRFAVSARLLIIRWTFR